jgi:hypothetical protein
MIPPVPLDLKMPKFPINDLRGEKIVILANKKSKKVNKRKIPKLMIKNASSSPQSPRLLKMNT